MKAVIQEKYGPPDDLTVRDVDLPTPADDEVLVRVRASSLNPDVWHVVTGRPWILRAMGAGFFRPKNPIPGADVAGVVESAGSAVTRFRPGDEVFGLSVGNWENGGALAEFAAVPTYRLEPKPENVSFEEAACIPSSGIIVLQNLRDINTLQPGWKVLVNGAAGGVGSLVLQIARSRGAHVTAVDAPHKLKLLRSLGADEVIDYTWEDFTRRGERYHLIVDIPGDRPVSRFLPALEPDGRYLPIGHDHYGAEGRRLFGLVPHFLGFIFLSLFRKQLRGPRVRTPSKQDILATLRELLADGTIAPVIARTFPLDEIHEAFRFMIEENPCGKVVIAMPEA